MPTSVIELTYNLFIRGDYFKQKLNNGRCIFVFKSVALFSWDQWLGYLYLYLPVRCFKY